RVLGRIRAARAGPLRRVHPPARSVVRGRQTQTSYIGDVPARTGRGCTDAHGRAQSHRQGRAHRIIRGMMRRHFAAALAIALAPILAETVTPAAGNGTACANLAALT